MRPIEEIEAEIGQALEAYHMQADGSDEKDSCAVRLGSLYEELDRAKKEAEHARSE
jgi:hypothetical protein